VFDFSHIAGLVPFDPQRVAFEITHAEAGTSKAGFPKVDVRLKISQPADLENRVVFDVFSFAPKALPFTKEKLVSLGMGDFKGTPEMLAEDLLGIDGVAAVGIRESDPGVVNPETGEPYAPQNTVKKYFPPGTPLSTNRIAELD
jgi:hypothetical protein